MYESRQKATPFGISNRGFHEGIFIDEFKDLPEYRCVVVRVVVILSL